MRIVPARDVPTKTRLYSPRRSVTRDLCLGVLKHNNNNKTNSNKKNDMNNTELYKEQDSTSAVLVVALSCSSTDRRVL